MVANNPVAINQLSHVYRLGMMGLQQVERKAFQLVQRVAELGYVEAHCSCSVVHKGGDDDAE